jgi:hypothetical protein
MSNEGARPSRTLIGVLKQLAPYAIAFVALGWVLHITDLHALLAALGQAPIAWFVVVSAVMLVANCAADTFAMTSVFGWFGCHVPYRELFVVRASTYLLAILNYHVGQAAIVGYLYRACKVPFFRATGWILFIIGVNVGTLFLLASVGASRATGELAMLRMVPVVCGAGVVVYATLLWLKPRILAERTLFAPLFEMGIAGHIKGVLVRLPHVGVLLVWHFISLRMFRIAVSPGTALLYLPAYFAVSSLPINVNGLGVAQLVAVAFFAPYAVVPAGSPNPHEAQKAAVIAYSLSTCGVSILLQLMLGFGFLRRGIALGLRNEPSPADGTAAGDIAA